MGNFNLEIFELLKIEGGYVNHPNDKGGKTKYGITEKVARENGYEGLMEDLPIEFAIKIYKEKYWDKMNLDLINSQLIAKILFNFAVNAGVITASKILQRGLNLLNRNNLSWFDLIVDGIIGEKTRKIVNSLSNEDELYLAKVLIGLMFESYVRIVEKDNTQEINIRGWINRLVALLKSIK